MDIASELRLAGLTVIQGRAGIGHTFGVAGIDVLPTKTGVSHEGADDINNIVAPARAVAYIERSGRVWLLADGPVEPNANAVVYLATYKGDPTDSQTDPLAVLLAVLGDAYALDTPDSGSNALDGDIEADADEPEGDDE
tara:strand:+ start:3495 stop:3911 length:417 start_codon:yes stop_codon:yes gene_type:complete